MSLLQQELNLAEEHWPALEQRIVILIHRDCGMIVQALGRQHLGQLAPLPRALLDLGPLVLKPDLDLILVQAQLIGQVFPPLLCEVPILLKLFL